MNKIYMFRTVWFAYILFFILYMFLELESIQQIFTVTHYDNALLCALKKNISYVFYACVFIACMAYPSTEFMWLCGTQMDKSDKNVLQRTLKGMFRKSALASLVVFLIMAVIGIGSRWHVLIAVMSLWLFITYMLPLMMLLFPCYISWVPRYTNVNTAIYFIGAFVLFVLLPLSLILALLYISNPIIQILFAVFGMLGLLTKNRILALASKEIARNYIVQRQI